MRVCAAFVLLRPVVIGMRVRSRVMPIRAIVHMPLRLVACAVLVPERHALPRGHACHALQRDGEGQQ